MTNCIIIHGCPGEEEKDLSEAERSYDKHRMPRLQAQLTQLGITNEKPSMPEPWAPNYDEYSKVFGDYNYNIDENTTLIGHSCGAAFLVRRLGEHNIKINHLILVAPWKIPEGFGLAEKNFYEYSIDETIKDRVNHITIFTADDEEDNGKLSAKIFHEALGGDLIELTGKGHYTLGDMETEEFPELIEVIKTHPAKTPLEH